MGDYNARIAPFIDELFFVTAKAGIYPSGGYHSGLDISTGINSRLYSICNGTVIGKGYQENGYGNYIIIKDNESDFAFLFGHMRDSALKEIGDNISIGEQFGVEGTTGNSTGIHVHIDMQNYVNNGNTWINNPSNSELWGTVYLPATDYMGFPNELGISVYYDGEITPILSKRNKTNFKFYLYKNKFDKKRKR